eukprot:Rhum_TRINITY_DN14412_c9_g1::Rhum_TRINITY_DN14412_c9_g1_i1::g.87823::m.87823
MQQRRRVGGLGVQGGGTGTQGCVGRRDNEDDSEEQPCHGYMVIMLSRSSGLFAIRVAPGAPATTQYKESSLPMPRTTPVAVAVRTISPDLTPYIARHWSAVSNCSRCGRGADRLSDTTGWISRCCKWPGDGPLPWRDELRLPRPLCCVCEASMPPCLLFWNSRASALWCVFWHRRHLVVCTELMMTQTPQNHPSLPNRDAASASCAALGSGSRRHAGGSASHPNAPAVRQYSTSCSTPTMYPDATVAPARGSGSVAVTRRPAASTVPVGQKRAYFLRVPAEASNSSTFPCTWSATVTRTGKRRSLQRPFAVWSRKEATRVTVSCHATGSATTRPATRAHDATRRWNSKGKKRWAAGAHTVAGGATGVSDERGGLRQPCILQAAPAALAAQKDRRSEDGPAWAAAAVRKSQSRCVQHTPGAVRTRTKMRSRRRRASGSASVASSRVASSKKEAALLTQGMPSSASSRGGAYRSGTSMEW